MLKLIKLMVYRRQLKTAYLRYKAIADGYSCGFNLAEHLSSRLRKARSQVNDAIDRIKSVDPTVKLDHL